MASNQKSLRNNFILYGTHPIRANADERNQWHSLQLTNRNGRTMATSHSFGGLAGGKFNEEDDETDIFEDAKDHFDDDNISIHSNRMFKEPKAIDWARAFQECDQINKLVFENHMQQALAMVDALKNRSLYHSLCNSTINYMKAVMTFDSEDIEMTVQATRNTIHIAKQFETSKPWITFGWMSKATLNEYELHAKLVYAEAVLLRALLSFTQDQGIFGFISAGLKLKECNDIYVKLSKQNDPSRFSSTVSYEHFDSGVRMGNGTFNLMISNLPQRIVRYLEFAGFSGDRELGLEELKRSAVTNGLRSTFSALYLLTYHTFVLQLVGNADGDMELCRMLIERNLQIYPDSYIFLFYKAKLQAIHFQLDQAIETFHYAIQCQQDWKNLHHIAFWELFWCYAFDQKWNEAGAMIERLFDENNWSKATYCYLLATSLFEANNSVANERVITLYKRVSSLKIRLAGKSIPLEKYAIKQCERFQAQGWLFLPGLEIIYLMNGFYVFAHKSKKLSATLELVNNAIDHLKKNRQDDRYFADSYGSGLLLRGVLLHFLNRFTEAQKVFDEILSMSKQFENRSFLPANACLEKALVYITSQEQDKAIEFLKKSLHDYKDYQLESRLQFRINAAIQTAKRMDLPTVTFSE